MHIHEVIGKTIQTKSGRSVTPLKYEVSYIGASYAGEPTAYCNISLVYSEEVETADGRSIRTKGHVNDIIFDSEKESIDIQALLCQLYSSLKQL